MTNKDIKKLVENLEHTLVSMQNDRNRDAFNLKLNRDRVSMLEAKLELKLEILNNRNNQVKEMSDKIQGLEKQVKNFDNLVNEKNESIGNLEFLIDKKNEKIESLKKEFGLLCKSIKDESIERDLLIAYSNSYIDSQKLK